MEQAQESIKHSSTDQDREKLRLQNNRETDRDNSSVSITKRDPVRDSQKDFVSDRTSSNLSSKDSPADDTSTYHRRWEDHRDVSVCRVVHVFIQGCCWSDSHCSVVVHFTR